MARAKKTRTPDREKYKRRIQHLLDNPPSKTIDGSGSFELDSHWAKYACVLVSGYLEKSVKELLHSYCMSKSEKKISHYIDKSWPNSTNMNSKNIIEVMGKFDPAWESEITTWLGTGEGSNKSVINSIVKTRNNIAHGSEAQTNGVTINSVTAQFDIAKLLVTKLESLIII